MLTRIVILFILSLTLLFSQNLSLKFERLSSEDGLSQNTIYDILQDNRGYMWFATQDGLNRFDGYDFKVYRHTAQDKTGGTSNYINSICQSSLNEIWAGTTTGLSILDPLTSRFRILNNVSYLTEKNISKIIRARDGSMWIGTMGAGISHMTPDGRLIDTFLLYRDSLYAQNAKNVKTLFQDDSGTIWAGTDYGGLFSISSGGVSRVQNYPRLSFLKEDAITAISCSAEGNLWIGTAHHGLYILSSGLDLLKNCTHVAGKPGSLSGNRIRVIYKDRQKRMWVGTEEGLNLYRPQLCEFEVFQNDPENPESLSNNDINCITMDKSGIVWIGTNNRGINRFSNFYTFFTNYQAHPGKENGLSSNIVWSFWEENDGRVWIGTEGGLDLYNPHSNTIKKIQLDKKYKISHKTIRRIFRDKSGKLWLATDGGGINIYDPKKKQLKILRNDPADPHSLSGDRVRAIVEDHNGDIWVGTLKGLNRYRPGSGDFKRYGNETDGSSQLKDNRILDLYVDASNAIWLATYNGLNRFNPKTEKFTAFNQSKNDSINQSPLIMVSIFHSVNDPDNILWIGTGNGLDRFDSFTGKFETFLTDNHIPSHVIYAINEDPAGYLWLSTGHGLLRFDKKTASVKTFNIRSGLLNDEFNASAAYRLSNNNLVFGGVKGVTYFNPLDIPENKIIPNIVITSFKKYDRAINIDSLISDSSEIHLSYKDKFISFEFAALDFTNSSNNRYRYMLENFDTDWIDNGPRRFASYTNLDGGHYIFRVIGTNNDGLWNKKGAAIRLYIEPPFWETTWFRIIFIVFFGILIRTYFNLRMRRIKNQKKHLQAEVNKRTKELYKRNIDLKKAQREQALILENVEEGFFLLDTDTVIQSQYSSALKYILEEERPQGKNLTAIIRPHLKTKDMQTVVEYLDILKDPDIDEDLIADLNPLNHCEFIFKGENGSFRSKFLAINFKRIYRDKKLTNLIATVIDETEEIRLKKRLSDSEENAKRQMEWIMGILHLDPSLLTEFVQSSTIELDQIAAILESDLQVSEFTDALTNIGRSLHLIKGNANLLNLSSFGDKIHQTENLVKQLLEHENLNGSDFLDLVSSLNQLQNDLLELKDLIDKIKRFNHPDKKQQEQDGSVMLKSLENMIERISTEQGKKVTFDYTETHCEYIPPHLRLLIKNTLVQLVRNSLSHGLETPQERLAAGKKETGCIRLATQKEDGLLKIFYSDDGHGLPLNKLRQKALESGKWNEQVVRSWGAHQIEEVIFVPGISSSDSINMLSGRGVGMDLVRDRIKSHGGKIEVESKESEYCKFKITLPITPNN